MKLTKSQLKRIIKEELMLVLKENDDWYDDESGHETHADRLWADNPASSSPADIENDSQSLMDSFKQHLRNHDWSYHYSDGKYYTAGADSAQRLRDTMKELEGMGMGGEAKEAFAQAKEQADRGEQVTEEDGLNEIR